MKEMLFVGLGGFIGSIARYKLTGLVLHKSGASVFPTGTIVVNVLGCLVVGVLCGLVERHHILSPHIRLLLITGVLGGFTTFSAFGFETIFLLRRELYTFAFANIAISILAGLLAVWLGLFIVLKS